MQWYVCSCIHEERPIGTHQVGIVGASGYGGAELVRLLAAHPQLDVAAIAAHTRAGQPIAERFPNLQGLGSFQAVEPDRLSELDLVFLSTPHEAALELVPALRASGTPVVDLSAAYRTPAEAFATWYGQQHPEPEQAPAVYGLTEWARAEVTSASVVANPGCYPTATLLGLLPLVELIEAGSVVVDAKSGSSGAGRGAKEHLHHPHLASNVVAYGAPAHRHTGEIEVGLARLGRDLGPVSFTPHLLPIARGLLATIHARLAAGVAAADVQDALASRYADEPFVTVLGPGTFPHTKAVSGSNACHVSAVVDPRTNRVVVTSAIDNLGKGAAGQALQNANLMLGLDEGLGLATIGMHP
ncbi:MAG: N-acetyl-gamma-glutamyl-phosphate reductase [Nitriliruptorales bacterium]|nr:N-acetyl-gamma-glutamyl-phosphate reductase [Nitriliruptorales bacterium]